MGLQVIKCPGGGYNIFSTISDGWMFIEPITAEQVKSFWVTRAAADALAQIEATLTQVDAGQPAYAQFTMTYEEADKLHRENHGPLKPVVKTAPEKKCYGES